MSSTTNRPLIAATRDEVSANLNLKTGRFPADWYGHVYVSSPVGSVNSDGLPFPPGNQESGTPIMNGDGYFFRFDLSPNGVHMQTGLMKPPDYWADVATRQGNPNGYGKLHNFWNMGISRMAMDLGTRNLLNTAVTPFRFANDPAPRLAACYDAGRPWEFDPLSMQLITVIGSNAEWVASTPAGTFPFPVVQASAHPSFDPATREFFFVNFTKDMKSLLQQEALAHLLAQDNLLIEKLFDRIAGDLAEVKGTANILMELQKRLLGKVAETERHALTWLTGIFKHHHEQKLNLADPAEVYLLRWSGGNGPMDKWRVVDESGKGIEIVQCMHQTTLTEDYVVLADATFKFTLDLMFNVPFSSPKLDNWLRKELTEPQLPYLDVYLVKRSELLSGQSTVVCRKVQQPIPLEAVHFTAEYANPDGEITIHLAHNSAACLAEWVRRFDRLAPNGAQAVDPEVVGLISTGTMDIGRIGKAVIDAAGGRLKSFDVIELPGNTADPAHIGAHTWGVGLYTYRDIISPDVAVPQLRHIYWSCYGMDPRLLTKFIYDLYYDYPNRKAAQAEMLTLTQQGVPFVISRQDTAAMQIADFYQFSPEVILKSVQFVPKRTATLGLDPQMDGYLFTTVLVNYPNAGGNNYQCEVWVFDAANLAQGPVCTLDSPLMNYAFTLHSAWTEQAATSQSTYKIDVRSDYDPLIASLKPELRRPLVQELFDRFVYPNFSDAPPDSAPRSVTVPVVEGGSGPGYGDGGKAKGPGKLGRLLGKVKRFFGGKKK
jgi:carotenoid cleavage dioxygenase-like enzyme